MATVTRPPIHWVPTTAYACLAGFLLLLAVGLLNYEEFEERRIKRQITQCEELLSQ